MVESKKKKLNVTERGHARSWQLREEEPTEDEMTAESSIYCNSTNFGGEEAGGGAACVFKNVLVFLFGTRGGGGCV